MVYMPFLFTVPVLVLVVFAILEHNRQRMRVEQLASRVNVLVDRVNDRPLDFLRSDALTKMLSLNSVLDRAEKKVRFLQLHFESGGILFSRRFWPLNRRIKDLETRVSQLENRSAVQLTEQQERERVPQNG